MVNCSSTLLYAPCRFYFLGDDDLLEILGQSKNPTVIQSHLKKLFAGIHKVRAAALHNTDHDTKP